MQEFNPEAFTICLVYRLHNISLPCVLWGCKIHWTVFHHVYAWVCIDNDGQKNNEGNHTLCTRSSSIAYCGKNGVLVNILYWWWTFISLNEMPHMVQNAAALLVCFAYASYTLFFLILYGGGKGVKLVNLKFLIYNARSAFWQINVCIHK